MILGTWFAGWAGWHWGPWAAIVAGAIGGALGGLLLALATVTFGVDHIVAGIAINLLAPGVCRFLASAVFVGQRGRDDHAVPDDVGDDRPLHLSVPRRRVAVRLEDAGRARLAGREAVVLRLRRGRPRPGVHDRPRRHDHPRAGPRPDLGLPAVAHALRPAAAVHRREALSRRLARRRRLQDQVHRRDHLGGPRRARRRVAGHRRPGLQREPGRRPRLPGPGRADLRQLAPGGPRRRRRALRVRAVAHPAHRHRTGAGPVPPRRAGWAGHRHRPDRPPPGAPGHRRAHHGRPRLRLLPEHRRP